MQGAPKGDPMKTRSTRLPDDIDDGLKRAVNFEDGERPSGYIRDAVLIRLYLDNDREFLEEAREFLDSVETAPSD